MISKYQENKSLLKRAIKELDPLLEKIAFVGGATTFLHLTENIDDVRATFDVDVIIDADRNNFYKTEQLLRNLGFQNDPEVLCRFKKDGLVIDMMPIDSRILGFSNRWYAEGLKTAVEKNIDGINIKVLDFPHFVATKLEAFNGRGKSEYFASKDIEDLVTVFAGRPGFLKDLLGLEGAIAEFIKAEMTKHLANTDFNTAIKGNFPRGSSAGYQRLLVDLKELTQK